MAKYLANNNTKEIHELDKTIDNCQIDEIKEDHKIPLESLSAVLNFIRIREYNGCKWCMPQYHTD